MDADQARAVAPGTHHFHFYSRINSQRRHPRAQMAPPFDTGHFAALTGPGVRKRQGTGIGVIYFTAWGTICLLPIFQHITPPTSHRSPLELGTTNFIWRQYLF